MPSLTVILSVLPLLVAADNSANSSNDRSLEIAAGLIWALVMVVLGIFIHQHRKNKTTSTMDKKQLQPPSSVIEDETYVEFDRLSVETTLENSMAWDSPVSTPMGGLSLLATPDVFQKFAPAPVVAAKVTQKPLSHRLSIEISDEPYTPGVFFCSSPTPSDASTTVMMEDLSPSSFASRNTIQLIC